MRAPSCVAALLALTACAGARVASTPEASAGSADSAAPAAASRATPPAPPPAPWTRTEPPPSLATAPRTAPDRQVQTMPNGLRVIVEQHRARPLVALRLIFPSGAAADPAESAGATYFAIQALTGTYDAKGEAGDLLKPDEKSARRRVAELGGALIAEVDADHAELGIDGFSRDTSVYLGTLLDLVKRPRCGENTFAALVDAVTDRLNELEVTDSAVLEEHLGRIAFGEGSAYARPNYGTADSLSRLGIEDVQDRQRRLLTPMGSTLLVAGDVDPEAVFRTVRKTLGAWYAPRASPSPRASAGSAPGRRRHVTLLPRTGARTTLVCAARRFGEKAASDAALALVARVLSERLDHELRDVRGLTYGASAVPLRHPGARAILACTRLDASHTEDGMQAFVAGIAGLGPSPPDAAELDRARKVLVSQWESARDSLDAAVAMYERGIAQDGDVDPAARIAALQAASVSEVQSLARNVSDMSRLQLVTSGETQRVQTAVRELKLGTVHVPELTRVATDDPGTDE